ncbi:hypothetical protein [Robbsia andropogonis]|uniref:hypothetical protein n=1 Tax=Robbsia andropogonis TaxID=28092 RepID=UPI0015885ED7|nr:hypothetical protein [Robbsia andropogonis]
MGLPTDANVIPLPDAVTKKRARGRPRKENALSNAERQKAFRARQAAACKSVTVTKNIDGNSAEIQRLLGIVREAENEAERRKNEIALWRSRIAELEKLIQKNARAAKKTIPQRLNVRQALTGPEPYLVTVSLGRSPARRRSFTLDPSRWMDLELLAKWFGISEAEVLGRAISLLHHELADSLDSKEREKYYGV